MDGLQPTGDSYSGLIGAALEAYKAHLGRDAGERQAMTLTTVARPSGAANRARARNTARQRQLAAARQRQVLIIGGAAVLGVIALVVMSK